MRIILSFFLLFFLTFTVKENVGLTRFKNVVIFGDSLSDTGNVYKLTNGTWPIVPPYYLGRFCNGPNWVDKLNLSQISNYAYGSATTDNDFVQGLTKLDTIPVPGVRQQIEMYFNNTNKTNINFATTLYILWAGGNDFIFNSSLTIPSIINSLMNSVRDLLGNGAKNILVFNQPPFYAFPYISQLNQTTYFTYLTNLGNNATGTDINVIQNNYTNSSVQIFDIYTLITRILSNNSSTFSNTVNNCWNEFNFTAIQILCPDPSKYVFLDTYHFTTLVHQLIADAIQPFLSYNGSNRNNESLCILLTSIVILVCSNFTFF
jgi:phospholipase/lecithinase/hemolysin